MGSVWPLLSGCDAMRRDAGKKLGSWERTSGHCVGIWTGPWSMPIYTGVIDDGCCSYILLCLASRRSSHTPSLSTLFLLSASLAYSVMSVFFFARLILPARTILSRLLALFCTGAGVFPTEPIPRCPSNLLFLHLSHVHLYLLGVSAAGLKKKKDKCTSPGTMIGPGNPVYPSGLFCFSGPPQGQAISGNSIIRRRGL